MVYVAVCASSLNDFVRRVRCLYASSLNDIVRPIVVCASCINVSVFTSSTMVMMETTISVVVINPDFLY